MKQFLFFIAGMLCSVFALHAQQSSSYVIHGIVKDAAGGQPLAGATLTLEKSRITAITNTKGQFTIGLPVSTDSLIITLIGYRPTHLAVSTSNESPLIVRMTASTTRLQEVVVSTGYQEIPKERATGSFDFIDNKTLNQQVSTNILDRINGVASGIMFDAKRISDVGNKRLPLSVRGLSTINGPEDPLIVVDNFPYEGDINNINPNNVESITILKDAAASSIWGAKAGNGVIVITTKSGRFHQPLHIALNSSVSWRARPDLLSQRQMPSSNLIDVEKFLFDQGYHFSDTANIARPPFSPVYEILFREKNGELTPNLAEQQIDALRNHDVRNDLERYFYQAALDQQYAVNLQGGSATDAYYFSAGYDRNIDELSARFSRINLSMKNTFRPVKRLRFTTQVAYSQSQATEGKPTPGSIKPLYSSLPSYTRLADDRGNALAVAHQYRQPFIDTLGGGRLLDWNYYPLGDYKHVHHASINQQLRLNLALDYQLTEALGISLKYQYANQHVKGRSLYDQDSYFTRNLINQYSDLTSPDEVVYNIPLGSILDRSNNTLKYNAVRGQVSLDKSWKANSIIAIAGTEITQSNETGNYNRIYGYDDDILSVSTVNAATYYPVMIGYGAYIPDITRLSDKLDRFISTFGNAAYTYNEKYTISISGRRDGSNLFGVRTNDKWTPLWSSGLSWNISREPFFKSSIFSYLKLRTTYGFSGNVDQSMAAVTTISYTSINPYTGNTIARVLNYFNPDLRWEKVRTINAGIDFNAFSDRLDGSIDVYQKSASELLGDVPLDYTVGLSRYSITKNVGRLVTHGIDIVLNSHNIDRGLQWRTSLLFNLNKDKVTQYNFKETGGIVGSGKTVMEGRPVWGIYSVAWAGLDAETGDPQGYFDGKLSKDYSSIVNKTPNSGLIFNGTTTPIVYGSLTNVFRWKQFTLDVMVAYRLGYYFRRPSISYSDLYARLEGDPDFSNRWKKPGDEKTTNVPSMIYPASSSRDVFYNNSEILVDKADNIRLQYIHLAYEIVRKQKSRLPVHHLQLFIHASNLGILWKANRDGIDPDHQDIRPSPAISAGLNASF